jgi:hypothetical protein
MVRFECDGCGVLKENGEPWILGFAAENIGVTAARREVTISDTWDDRRSRDWLAVHFCSEECRGDYMGKLFGESAAPTGTKQTKRIQRMVPGAVVDTQVTERETPLLKRTVRRRKAS